MYGSARSVGKVEPSSQSPGRSPRLPRSPRLGHRRTNSTGGSSGSSVAGGSGKTLSMENIQSLNAAYATSGPMYLSDHENVGAETPKSTMTLGRSGGRLPYGVRMTAMGSSPNIASSGVASETIAFGDHHLPPVSMASTVPHSLRQARDNTIMDLQTQLKEVLRENDLLRKDVEVKESKLSSSMNSIKTFWSPELKKERALRKDEASKITVWKEQYRVVQEENQVSVPQAICLSWLNARLKGRGAILFLFLAYVSAFSRFSIFALYCSAFSRFATMYPIFFPFCFAVARWHASHSCLFLFSGFSFCLFFQHMLSLFVF